MNTDHDKTSPGNSKTPVKNATKNNLKRIKTHKNGNKPGKNATRFSINELKRIKNVV